MDQRSTDQLSLCPIQGITRKHSQGPKSQKDGCGFPIAQIGVIFSLARGAPIALCIDVLKTHDIKLARKLYKFLNPLDILLGGNRSGGTAISRQ